MKPSTISEKPEVSPQSSKSRGKQSRLFMKLDDYQQKAVIFSAGLDGSALFCEQRTGKTWISIALLEYVNAQAALFVVPLNNIETTWVKTLKNELPAWKVCRTVEEFKAATGRRVLLVHYESLRPMRRNKARASFLRKFMKLEWDLVIFDESQKLKSRSSANSRLALRLNKARRRVILSGTPMDKSP